MKANPMQVYKLAKIYAARYAGKGIDYEDLLATAMLGVVIACNKYDESRGALTTIAVYHMRDELNRACYRPTTQNLVMKRKQRFIEETYGTEIIEIMLDDKFNTIENECYLAELSYRILEYSERLPKVQRSAFLEYLKTESYDNHIEKYGRGNFKTNRSSASSSDTTAKRKIISWMKESLDETA